MGDHTGDIQLKATAFISFFTLLFGITGCNSWGPRSLVEDRVNYVTAIARSSKEQILTNLVRYRYGDVTAFLDLKQIVSGYTYGGTLGVNVLPDNFSETAEIGGSLRYEGRPTLTYAPLDGRAFFANILTPIPPSAIFSVLRAGWPVDLVLGTTVQKINGVSNGVHIGRYRRPADREFWKIVELIEKLYAEDVLDFRILDYTGSSAGKDQKGSDGPYASGKSLLWLEDTEASEDTRLEIDSLKKLLGLGEELSEFELVYGRIRERSNQIVIMTHSIMTILASFAAQIDIPRQHVEEGRAPANNPGATHSPGISLIIKWGPSAPVDAYAKTQYLGQWYWIDGKDYASKRTFSFLTLLFSLSDRGESAMPPLVTIQAN